MGERKSGDTSLGYDELKDSDAESERNNLVKERLFIFGIQIVITKLL